MLGMSGQCFCRLYNRAMSKRESYYAHFAQNMKKAGKSCTSISNTNEESGSLRRNDTFRHSHYSLDSLIIWMRNARDKKRIHSELNKDSCIVIKPLYYLFQDQNSVIRDIG